MGKERRFTQISNTKIVKVLNILSNPVVLFVCIFELFIGLLVYFVEPFSKFTYSQILNLYLTNNIALFAIIEGASTYAQYRQNEKRFLIENAKNELEKAYGPLYTILNTISELSSDDKSFILYESDKISLDEIISTFPYMFPSEIYNFWKDNIRDVEWIQMITSPIKWAKLPIKFRDMINKEYDKRVTSHNKLLKK